MLIPPDTLTGSRIVLRRPVAGDAKAIHACCSDPDVVRYMDWPLQTEFQKTEDHMAGWDARWTSGEEFQWVIALANDPFVCGTIACRVRDHAADFGYFTNKSYWGRGIAFDAATMLMTWLKQQPGILRIWATVDFENDRSIRLLQKLGLEHEGTLRMATRRPNIGGKPRDTLILSWVRQLD
jgi:[ribosomal protein S5]-alanine N-acetyltransferase